MGKKIKDEPEIHKLTAGQKAAITRRLNREKGIAPGTKKTVEKKPKATIKETGDIAKDIESQVANYANLSPGKKAWLTRKAKELGVTISKSSTVTTSGKKIKVAKVRRKRWFPQDLLESIEKRKKEGWNWCVVCNRESPPSGMSKETIEPYCNDCYSIVKYNRAEGKRVFVEVGKDIEAE